MKPTQEQVIAWAREAAEHCNAKTADDLNKLDGAYAIKFATLAYEAGRKDENEACAEVCEGAYLSERTALFAAGLIRARREQ